MIAKVTYQDDELKTRTAFIKNIGGQEDVKAMEKTAITFFLEKFGAFNHIHEIVFQSEVL